MIDILIVDDNNDKLTDITTTIISNTNIVNDNIEVVGDLISAKRKLSTKQYDVIIVDLNLPTRQGGEPKPYNGITLIDEIRHSTVLRKPTHILALTEYVQLIDEYTYKFHNEMVFLLLYEDSSDVWRNQILSYLQYAQEVKASDEAVHEYDYDIAIITALHDPEFFYLLKLNANWQKKRHLNDSTFYYEGVFETGAKKLKVVAAAAPQMGMPASTTLSLKIIQHYKPKYIAIVGIAAGVRGKCELGDILITDISWDYGSGKIRRSSTGVTFEPDPRSLALCPEIKERLLSVVRERKYLDDIRESWNESTVGSVINVHVGPVASGAAVLEDAELIKEIMSHNRKLIGIEMEIYGLFYAAINCPEPRPRPIAIKSVCDYGDSDKNSDYQKYASYVSCNFFYRFAIDELAD